MDLVKCEGVRKVYGSGNSEVVALDGIDLTVRKGEFVAVTG
ncbi:MAG TPA: ABC transporter ATP-binding protein, partial [Candidatus Choladousia intestinipullorum]|nr:ABC transporter ATP-binding protein [Candidatus Choladousia intestinipullorum]